MSEFYVGYQPKAPLGLARLLSRLVVAILGLVVTVSLALVFGQHPFADSKFEFQQYREYEGVLVDLPYPHLFTTNGSFLLVAPGKHGASGLVKGLNDRTVRLSGALIQRGSDRMLELLPGSLRMTGGSEAIRQRHDLGEVTLRGEIVDSKCFLGVMNPGNGKVHRACAARCISGGIPPAFIVRDAAGATQTLLLTGVEGREILDFVAEPVTIRGRLTRSDGTLFLAATRSGNKPAITRD